MIYERWEHGLLRFADDAPVIVEAGPKIPRSRFRINYYLQQEIPTRQNPKTFERLALLHKEGCAYG